MPIDSPRLPGDSRTSTGCQILKDATATFMRVVGARRQTQGTRGISYPPVIDNLSRYPDNRSPRLWRTVVQIETELELGRIRHEAGMPWRIEHDFNMNFLDTGQPREPALHLRLAPVAPSAPSTTLCH